MKAKTEEYGKEQFSLKHSQSQSAEARIKPYDIELKKWLKCLNATMCRMIWVYRHPFNAL